MHSSLKELTPQHLTQIGLLTFQYNLLPRAEIHGTVQRKVSESNLIRLIPQEDDPGITFMVPLNLKTT